MDRPGAERLYDSGKEPTVAKLLEYDAENTRLKRKIAQLQKNSTNSSKPPSSDNPCDKKEKSKSENGNDSRKRRPGGQPGHKGTKRHLVPVEEVNDLIHYYPKRCAGCGKKLPQGETANEVCEPFRWQVAEIEPIKPMITEHQAHSILCECGCQTSASLPKEVAKSNFGPRLSSIIAYLAAVLHVSRRGTQEFCQTLLNINIALGSVQNLLEDTSAALEPIDMQLRDALPEKPVINSDETGWRDRWLWIFVSSAFIYFQVAKSRSSKVLVDVLGKVYKGILCVDRWGAYTKYHKGLFQICWAHLKRDFHGILKIGEATESRDAVLFAETMEKLRKKLMATWYRYKKGEISRAELVKKSRPIRNAIKRSLKQHADSQERCVRVLANKLLKRSKDLFTFIFCDGVEPTNNIAERGIRPAVQWRKICFGNRSDNGAVLTSRLLTVTRTCWLQKRNSLEFLVEAVTAHRSCKRAPSLI
jgi:transposase